MNRPLELELTPFAIRRYQAWPPLSFQIQLHFVRTINNQQKLSVGNSFVRKS